MISMALARTMSTRVFTGTHDRNRCMLIVCRGKQKRLYAYYQAVLRIRDVYTRIPDPDFYPSRIPDPKKQQKRGGGVKKN
jgi:hypothetical protein